MVSRYPIIKVEQHDIEEMSNVEEEEEFPIDFKVISNHQQRDNDLQKIIRNKKEYFSMKFVNDAQLIFRKDKNLF